MPFGGYRDRLADSPYDDFPTYPGDAQAPCAPVAEDCTAVRGGRRCQLEVGHGDAHLHGGPDGITSWDDAAPVRIDDVPTLRIRTPSDGELMAELEQHAEYGTGETAPITVPWPEVRR